MSQFDSVSCYMKYDFNCYNFPHIDCCRVMLKMSPRKDVLSCFPGIWTLEFSFLICLTTLLKILKMSFPLENLWLASKYTLRHIVTWFPV